MINYSKTVNISEVEWLVIDTLRRVQANKFGEVNIKISEGYITDIVPVAKIDREKIRILQT